MIYIVTAPPGWGKTAYLTHMGIQAGFDRCRTLLMQDEIRCKMENGFLSLKTIPQHCVSANYDIAMRQFLCTPRRNRRINPYRLGFANKEGVDVHFTLPYEFICITEAQKYYDSRRSKFFPSWQSRWFEAHRHNDLTIYMDTQRHDLIDKNIRSIAQIIEIHNLYVDEDRYGEPCRLIWELRKFESARLYDYYLDSGSRDRGLYVPDVEIANYNVFACYDSKGCKPKFYDGHLNQDFDYLLSEPTKESFDEYVRLLKLFDDEMPDNYLKYKGAA